MTGYQEKNSKTKFAIYFIPINLHICNKMLSTGISPTRLKYRRFYHHINCNHTLVNEQFGFRNNSPTEIASYNFINDTLFLSLNSKLMVGGVF
jgi:hypothetical protein